MKKTNTTKLTLTALFAALSYCVFTFLQVKIPLPGGDATSFHLGNAVCVIAALILGGFYGGLAGAIGMTIGDLLDPVYIIYAPKTFLLKLMIGLITGFIAHRIGHISTRRNKQTILFWTVVSAAGGLLFNVVADPVTGYFYKLLLLKKAAADIVIQFDIAAAAINAVLSLIVSVIVYTALQPFLAERNAESSSPDIR